MSSSLNWLASLVQLPPHIISPPEKHTQRDRNVNWWQALSDERTRMWPLSCGPLMCILSETVLVWKSFIRGRKSSQIFFSRTHSHTHVEGIDRNTHKHTAGTWSKTVTLIPFWAYGYTSNRPPPLFFTFTHIHTWTSLAEAQRCSPSRTCITVISLYQGNFVTFRMILQSFKTLDGIKCEGLWLFSLSTSFFFLIQN